MAGYYDVLHPAFYFAALETNNQLNVQAANRFIAAALGGDEAKVGVVAALKEENKKLKMEAAANATPSDASKKRQSDTSTVVEKGSVKKKIKAKD